MDQEIFVDSSFFYGYLITQIPAGFFASILPATKIFGTSIALSSFLNLLIMGAMSLDNVTVLCTIRFIQGLTDVSSTNLVLPSTPVHVRDKFHTKKKNI